MERARLSPPLMACQPGLVTYLENDFQPNNFATIMPCLYKHKRNLADPTIRSRVILVLNESQGAKGAYKWLQKGKK